MKAGGSPTQHDDPERPARRRGSVVAWLLVLALLCVGGGLYLLVHKPLVEEAARKDTALADLTQQAKKALDAQREADAGKEALQTELQKLQAELEKVRADLARS